MKIALYSLIPIFISILAGMHFHRLRITLPETIVSYLSNGCLYLLLLCMGITIGSVPNIIEKLLSVGLSAATIALSTSIFIAIFVVILSKLMHPQQLDKSARIKATSVKFNIYSYLKDPLQLLGLVALGFTISHLNFVPEIKYENIVTYLLYAMIFFIGVRLSQSNLRLREIFLNKFSISLAAVTIFSSLLGAWVASGFLNLSPKDTMAISSGFGWYTLSGILFTQMNEPVLGSIAFLSDLFREIIALLLISVLSKKGYSSVAIGICGATSMDVTLPVIEKHCGQTYVPTAFISGAIITLLVPFMIPFFYYLK